MRTVNMHQYTHWRQNITGLFRLVIGMRRQNKPGLFESLRHKGETIWVGEWRSWCNFIYLWTNVCTFRVAAWNCNRCVKKSPTVINISVSEHWGAKTIARKPPQELQHFWVVSRWAWSALVNTKPRREWRPRLEGTRRGWGGAADAAPSVSWSSTMQRPTATPPRRWPETPPLPASGRRSCTDTGSGAFHTARTAESPSLSFSPWRSRTHARTHSLTHSLARSLAHSEM